MSFCIGDNKVYRYIKYRNVFQKNLIKILYIGYLVNVGYILLL